ncbi:MAG: helix-turn-helix domain-containing protein [Burkholderiales bacterium]|nr:helix-turn-helix domain-containing protein [Burkholderiales bacterium]
MTPATHTSIGAHLRHLRERAGLRQDDVARAARERGLAWTRATVAALEIDRRELSLAEFVTLRGRPVQDDELAAFFTPAAPRRRVRDAVAVQLDAEVKAAKRLGVTPERVVAAARRRWGRSLTEERDRVLNEHGRLDRYARDYWRDRGQDVPIADARARQAVRGHITRRLVAELAQDLQLRTAMQTRKGRR